MTHIPIKPTCPLGSVCEAIKDGAIHRCKWFTEVMGMNPQTGEQINRWDCAIAWLPVLTLEMSRTNQGQTAALENLRNIVADDNQRLLEVARHNSRLLP